MYGIICLTEQKIVEKSWYCTILEHSTSKPICEYKLRSHFYVINQERVGNIRCQKVLIPLFPNISAIITMEHNKTQ